MTYSITRFSYTDEEYEHALRLRNAFQPDEPSSVKIWRYWDKVRLAEILFQRLLARDAHNQLIALGEIEESSPARETFSLSLMMYPAAWSTDLPDTLLHRLLESIAQHGNIRLRTVAAEDDKGKLAFLHRYNFKTVMRSPVSTLDVSSFDSGPYESLTQRIKQDGFELGKPPGNWQHDPVWQQRIFDLYWMLLQDTPHYETRIKPPLARFVQAELRHPNFLPGGYFLALDDQQLIGMTSLVKRGGATEVLGAGLTGVIRSYRRRGLATALKVKAIKYAQSLKARRLATDNEENNPMYLLNQRLGFTPQPARLHLETQIQRSG
jgi:GNAT superfamily N-acetyltransferase